MLLLNRRSAALAALILAGIGATVPMDAAAQQPEPQQQFDMRMSNRIDGVQSQVKRLQQELDGEGSEDGAPTGEYDSNSGLRRQLEALDEQCLDLERQLRSSSMPLSSYDEYQRQRTIEYNVQGMEQQLRKLRNWMHKSDDEVEETSSESPPTPDTVEDDISDAEWAEEWARDGR